MQHDDLGIKADNGILLTRDFLSQEMIRFHATGKDGVYVLYHRHENGGGFVADNSFVPSNFHLPTTVTVGPCTRLLDDQNLCGQTWVQGDTRNHVQISRKMTADDEEERQFRDTRILHWLNAELRWHVAESRACLRAEREVKLSWRLRYKYADFQERLLSAARWQAQNDPMYHKRLELSGIMS